MIYDADDQGHDVEEPLNVFITQAVDEGELVEHIPEVGILVLSLHILGG